MFMAGSVILKSDFFVQGNVLPISGWPGGNYFLTKRKGTVRLNVPL